MADGAGKGVAIIGGVATVGTAVAAAWASIVGVKATNEVSTKQQEIEKSVQSLGTEAQGRQIEADLSKRREEFLAAQLPRLLSPDPSERNQARELLLALVPTDLAGVL